MKNKFKKIFRNFAWWLGVAVIGVSLGFTLQLVLAAWTEPAETPPGGNVDAPINTGAIDQTKPGLLGVNKLKLGNKWLLSGVGDFYTNDGWLRLMKADGSGYYGGFAADYLYGGTICLGGDCRTVWPSGGTPAPYVPPPCQCMQDMPNGTRQPVPCGSTLVLGYCPLSPSCWASNVPMYTCIGGEWVVTGAIYCPGMGGC